MRGQSEDIVVFRVRGKESRCSDCGEEMRGGPLCRQQLEHLRQAFGSATIDFSPRGVDGLFSSGDVTELFSILQEIKKRAAA